MPRIRVAHLREQGQDMIIVPLDASFGGKTNQDQQAIMADLQVHANSAGLLGTVVPVWGAGGGQMRFVAPQPWQSFLSGLSLPQIFANLNKEIFW